MQRFGANGEKLGAEEQVAEYVESSKSTKCRWIENGGFVVSWTGYNADTKTYDIFTQRYDDNGNKIALGKCSRI